MSAGMWTREVRQHYVCIYHIRLRDMSRSFYSAFANLIELLSTESSGSGLVHLLVLSLWKLLLWLTKLCIVCTLSKYILFASKAPNAWQILLINLLLYCLRLLVLLIGSVLEYLSLRELEVAVRALVLRVEALTFICQSKRSRRSCFHNSRFIWLPW